MIEPNVMVHGCLLNRCDAATEQFLNTLIILEVGENCAKF